MGEVQGELLPIVHEGGRRDRLRKESVCPTWVNAERIYLAEWKRWNRRNGALSSLLAPQGKQFAFVSPRDAYVAATVIQWLGTNCGLAFIEGCERKLAEARKRVSVKRRLLFADVARVSLVELKAEQAERDRQERAWRARQRAFTLEE